MKPPRAPDEKQRALRSQSVLYARAATVTDELFQSLEFFDPRDLVQVKYDMVRRVRQERWSVTRAAAAFGFSRISYYRIQHAIETQGLVALMPHKRGPRHPTKITDTVAAFLRQRLEEDPAAGSGKLKSLLAEELGVQVHKRTIERALQGKKKPHRATTPERSPEQPSRGV